jgi:acetolactate synthase-1/2/3 large subunit
VGIGLWGDARDGLADLHGNLAARPRKPRPKYLREIAERRHAWASSTAPKYASSERPIGMARLIGELNRHLPADSILVADGGFASHWAGLLYDTKRSGRSFITDRGFASIGYGLPGCLGAQLASPGNPVVGLTGDGGMNMSIGGLETARRVGASFTLIVVNNAASGYVKALQHAMYGAGNYQSSDLTELDYSRLAQAYGCLGIRVDDPGRLAAALDEATSNDGSPTVIDVTVTRDPGAMLPGVDSRTHSVQPGDRPA